MALEHIEKRAARIAERRGELGLTQEQVADLMQDAHKKRNPDAGPDKTRGQMVSDWERAVNEPSPAKLELLADALETTVADLNAGPKADRARKPATAPDPFVAQQGEPPVWAIDLQEKVDQILDALKLEAPPDPASLDDVLDEPEPGEPGAEDHTDEGESGAR